MTDERDEDTPAGAFPWGLTPGGGAEEPAAPASEPPVVTPPLVPPPVALPPAAPPAYLPPTEPPAFPPPAAAPPNPYDMPTQAIDRFPPLDPAIEGVTEALSPQPVGLPDPVDEGVEASAIDSLFGDAAFVEYEEAPIIPPPPTRRQPTAGPGQELVAVPVAPRPPRAPIPRVQKILMGVAGGLVAALALVALFVLGTRLAVLMPPPAVAASPSPSPSPSASGGPLAIGPVAPGLHRWDELLGGECLEPFESAWQDEYTVVQCTAPHAAQHVSRGVFDDPEGTAYPRLDELQSRINLLCTSPAVIDFALAGTVLDLQVTASFAVDAEQWDDGDRDYFCFVDRAGGEPITGSLAVPPAVPATSAP
jgi:hypothetical protein